MHVIADHQDIIPVNLQAVLKIPRNCPKCFAHGWAQLHRNHRGMTIALEWSCANCQHRWPVHLDDIASIPSLI